MREIAEAPLLPLGARRQLPLAPVMPLIAYLDSFEDKSQERDLTFKEDAMAAYILMSLVPEDSPAIAACVGMFLDPHYRTRRTLAQWYFYARHLAKHFAQGD